MNKHLQQRILAALAIAACATSAGCSKKTPPSEGTSPTATETGNAAAPPTDRAQAAPAPGPGGCSAHLAAAPPAPINNPTCTATEAVAWSKDNTGACLDCLFASGCLDDKRFSGQECADLPGGAGSSNETLCAAVLACDFGVTPTRKPAPANGMTVNAFCKQGASSESCASAPDGLCAAEWKAGFAGQPSKQIVASLGQKSFPAGMANSISICANANCAQCF
jgi:hypothetical protein